MTDVPNDIPLGVIGGSGFYSFLDDVRTVEPSTPYGEPSGPITIGKVGDRSVAFVPRHGVKHQFPPHMVPYRANVWALKELGVQRIVGPSAVGSLQPHVKPGEFVVGQGRCGRCRRGCAHPLRGLPDHRERVGTEAPVSSRCERA